MDSAAQPALLLGKPPIPVQPTALTGAPERAAGEIAALVNVIAGLADGNCVARSDVTLIGGDAQTRAVSLSMTVTLSWASTIKSSAGRRPVPGSRDCSGASVQDYLASVCGLACRDAATSKKIADTLALNPVAEFEGLQNGYRVGSLPYAAHKIKSCSACDGHGDVRCTVIGCNNGKVQCNACGFTGMAVCTHCNGGGQLVQSDGYHTCRQCGGSGRYGNCHMCLGTLHVACSNCRGSGHVGCGPCGQTGAITDSYSTHLVGNVGRGMSMAADTPEGFKRSCKAVTSTSALAKSVGSLVRAEVSCVPGEARLTLHCQTRHVHADIACGSDRISVDALGPDRLIPLMPTFLDDLTAELAYDIQTAARTEPAGALKLATRARVTRDVLASVLRGSRSDAAVLAKRWQGAASLGHVELVEESLRSAYGRAVRSPVRRTWLLMSPIIVVGSVLANAYQAPLWMLTHTLGTAATTSALKAIIAIFLTEGASVLPFVLFAWVVAARSGSRRLRASLGKLAPRGPRQGVWPALGLLLAMVAGFATVALRLDAEPMGLPWAPAMRAGGRSLQQVFGGEHEAVPAMVKSPMESHVAPARVLPGTPTHRP